MRPQPDLPSLTVRDWLNQLMELVEVGEEAVKQVEAVVAEPMPLPKPLDLLLNLKL